MSENIKRINRELKAYTMEELKQKIFSKEIEDSKTVAALMAYAVKYGC